MFPKFDVDTFILWFVFWCPFRVVLTFVYVSPGKELPETLHRTILNRLTEVEGYLAW